jgi:hypothetical protein
MTPENSPKPFFVFGSPRSGTSLLSRMLGHHENLVVPPESLLFKMFWSFKSNYGDLSITSNQLKLLKDMMATRIIGYWSPKPDFERVVSLIKRPGFGGVVEALIISYGQDKEIKFWGEKSPGHAFFWPQIRSCFPEAKVVHIVRDGRDTAISFRKARMGPKTYYAAAKYWVNYLEAMDRVQSNCSPDNFIEVRYEDLLHHPEQTLNDVCTFLGVSYSVRMLRFHEEKSPYRTDARNTANLQKPLMKNNLEKWRASMSKSELREFESVASIYLSRYDYVPAWHGPPLSRSHETFIRLLYSPAARFISRAKDRQGQKEFLNLQSIKARRILKRQFSKL